MLFMRTILLPLTDHKIILPSTTIAEIIPMETITKLHNSPNWLHGIITWRKIEVPVISLETLTCNSAPTFTEHSKIAILHMVYENISLNFMGIILQALPKVLNIIETDITATLASDKEFYSCKIKVKDVDAYIVDLKHLQPYLAQNLVKLR